MRGNGAMREVDGFSLGQWETEVALGHLNKDAQQAQVSSLFCNWAWAKNRFQNDEPFDSI